MNYSNRIWRVVMHSFTDEILHSFVDKSILVEYDPTEKTTLLLRVVLALFL